jgi:hypothetical protein
VVNNEVRWGGRENRRVAGHLLVKFGGMGVTIKKKKRVQDERRPAR